MPCFHKFDSAYQLAIVLQQKMEERLNVALTAHSNLMKFNANTKYKDKANEKC
jgi:outer membrane protein assembly factor BamD